MNSPAPTEREQKHPKNAVGGRGRSDASRYREGDNVLVRHFSKDHYSMLAYLEQCHVEPQTWEQAESRPGLPPGDTGRFSLSRLRVNGRRHPGMKVGLKTRAQERQEGGWDEGSGTRLSDRSVLGWHDDVDVLDDLQECGWMDLLNPSLGTFALTPLGRSVALAIREHKAGGGTFATFRAHRQASHLFLGVRAASDVTGVPEDVLRQTLRSSRPEVDSCFKAPGGGWLVPRGLLPVIARMHRFDDAPEESAEQPGTADAGGEGSLGATHEATGTTS